MHTHVLGKGGLPSPKIGCSPFCLLGLGVGPVYDWTRGEMSLSLRDRDGGGTCCTPMEWAGFLCRTEEGARFWTSGSS